jgi:hypothetical protein
MEINHLKLNDREYLLRKDEWIRRFEDLESNEVTAFYNRVSASKNVLQYTDGQAK